MLKTIHKKYHKGELTLRDYLAAHRTILANDRTWMGSLRTSLTFFVAGISFLQFFDSPIIMYMGYIFIPIGIIVFLHGTWKYHKRYIMIHDIEKNSKIKKHFDE